jgi:hypothetical protein
MLFHSFHVILLFAEKPEVEELNDIKERVYDKFFVDHNVRLPAADGEEEGEEGELATWASFLDEDGEFDYDSFDALVNRKDQRFLDDQAAAILAQQVKEVQEWAGKAQEVAAAAGAGAGGSTGAGAQARGSVPFPASAGQLWGALQSGAKYLAESKRHLENKTLEVDSTIARKVSQTHSESSTVFHGFAWDCHAFYEIAWQLMLFPCLPFLSWFCAAAVGAHRADR